jgi:hypothetical protein
MKIFILTDSRNIIRVVVAWKYIENQGY